MAKLYIFGIGGTGSRIIKSFTMLMASGVKLEGGITDVIPIILDPDVANGDMDRTLDILTLYQKIHGVIEEPDMFYYMRMQTLPQLTNPSNPSSRGNFQFKVDGTSNQRFKDFIGRNVMSPTNRGLTDLLFSEKNLNSSMDVGFKGNPNIGSTVLNQIAESIQFKEFAQSFTNGDKIFIVSSIFGGTGAAGFPLILKNLRNGDSQLPNSGDIQDAVIGALSVLPYFSLTVDDESSVDPDTFYDKAKAALTYYDRTLLQTQQLNTLYYIGDTPRATYDNQEGGTLQKNAAHFIEMAGAYAIVDFCRSLDHLGEQDGIPAQTEFKEFGIPGNVNPITFDSLDQEMQNVIGSPLTMFKFLSNYIKLGLPKALGVTNWTKDPDTQTTGTFFYNDINFKNLKNFLNYFDEWLMEMAQNIDPFIPFNLGVTEKNVLEFVNGKKPKREGLLRNNLDFRKLERYNNRVYRNYIKNNPFTQFIKMAETSTHKVLTDRKLI